MAALHDLRLRSADALPPLPGGPVFFLRAALIVFILARLPVSSDLDAVVKKLREAAELAGCASPSVMIRWRSEREQAEIEVRCREAGG